jgi:hypothetical protein
MVIGLSHDEYWDMLPVDYRKYLELYENREKQRSRETDALNWILGRYIAYAFNDPKKYPKKPYLYEEEKTQPGRVMTSEEMDRRIRAWNRALGGSVK